MFPSDIAVDGAGNVYIADPLGYRIRKITVATGVVASIAGIGQPSSVMAPDGEGGPAAQARVTPGTLAVDAGGTVYFYDQGLNRIRRISGGILTSVAFSQALPFGVFDIAVRANGDIYFTSGSRVMRIAAPAPNYSAPVAVAGDGNDGFGGDGGPATLAQLSSPLTGVAVDAAGNVYISDANNYRIRKVTAGIITTIAGDGVVGFSGENGPAQASRLGFPDDLTLDTAGNLYVVDNGNRVRMIAGGTANGAIRTVAGTGYTNFFSGDGALATAAPFKNARTVAVDSQARSTSARITGSARSRRSCRR